MSDLVERLRSLADVEAHTSACRATCTCGHVPALYRVTGDAATEIERQQAEIEAQARLLGMSAEREMALRGEIERLRAALEKIAGNDWVENCLDPQWAQSVARAALENRHG